MRNMLETSSNWLETMRDRHTTVEVAYGRDPDSVDLSATIGRTVFEIDNGRGVLEKIESRDFLVLRKELILGGNPVLPERGDKVRETKDGTVYVYEVMAPGKEPHYRYSDPYRKTLRIHTKQVDTEVAP